MRKRDRLPSASTAAAKRRRWIGILEQLEMRQLLTVSSGAFDVGNLAGGAPTSTSVADVKNGPLANAGEDLISLYKEYRRFNNSGGDDSSFDSSLSDQLIIDDSRVVVTVRGATDLASLQAKLQSVNATIIATNSTYNVVSAFVPIDKLRSVAGDDAVASLSPIDRPISWAQQGVANNQADDALLSDQVRSSFGLDGSEIKVGVLSNTVNALGGGISSSVGTGDLPPNITVLQEGIQEIGVATDEGRAMLELIHDIAPGAQLYFATADGGQQNFADNIRALNAAGCKVIVDDVGYFLEPFFQPGVIDQAISDVVKKGSVYLSAVGNGAQDGYEALTRFVKVGSHRYVDFNGGTAVDTRMRIDTNGGEMVLQWDNPYNGLVGSATTDLDVYLYDIHHPDKIIEAGTTNNLKTGLPVESIFVPVGQYDMVIRVSDSVPGKALPTRFKFVISGGPTPTINSLEYDDGIRSAAFGHSVGADTISVGAVPFYDVSPFVSSTNAINSEFYSSYGLSTQVFDANGIRLPSPLTLQKPDISGVDGINTSFFTGTVQGVPVLPLGGDIPQDPDSLPNFFGTSAAAPNVAAVVALMLDAAPNATKAQVLNALKATARPLNSSVTGSYDQQGGFGLVDAFSAVQQFVTRPTVKINHVASLGFTPIDSIKIIFNQQVSGFDVSDLRLSVDGGPNLLTGNNSPTTTDGGRTWNVQNLDDVTTTPGNYVLKLVDVADPIVNVNGLAINTTATLKFTILADPPTPKAPSGVVATVLSNNTVRLDFNDNSSNEDFFAVQRSSDSTFKTGVKSFIIDANSTSFTDPNPPLSSGPIFYRVRAYNIKKEGSAYSSVVQVNAISGGEVVLDNDSHTGVKITGNWNASTDGSFLGETVLDDGNTGKGSKSVKFTPSIQASGDYFIYGRWTRGGNRATNVPVDINIGGKSHTITINEKKTGGSGWVLLGKFSLAKGSSTSVTFSNAGTDGLVTVDAVRFLPADAGIS